MRRALSAFTHCLLALPAFAQAPAQLWTATYNGPANHQDQPYRVALAGGGLLVAGRSYSTTTWDDIVLLRYSPRGDLLWRAQFDGAAHAGERPSDLLPDGRGGAFVCGYSQTGATWEARVLRYDRDGELVWTDAVATPGVISVDWGPQLARTPDGGLRMAATSDGNMLVAAWDEAGARLWTRAIDVLPGELDFATDLAVDSAGDAVVVGPVGTGFGGTETVKLDAAGNVLWADNEFGSFGSTLGPAWVRIDANDEIVVTGVPESSCGLHHMSTWRLAPDGTRLWTRSFPAGACDTAIPVGTALDADGNTVVLCQSMISSESGSFNFCTVKYDAAGNQLWQQSVLRSGVDLPSAVEVDRAGNVYITGAAAGAGNSYDTFVASYTPAGSVRWTKVFNSGDTNDSPADIVVSPRGEVYFSEMAYHNGTNDDIVTVKLGGSVRWAAPAER